MDLDDLERFKQVDQQNMQAAIDALPDQLEDAWALGARLPRLEADGLRQIVIAGMGGSAIGADLLAAYLAPQVRIPLIVWRGYDLPAYAHGEHTLVIASSHSGNTEETLSAYAAGQASGARMMALTTGGQLAEKAAADGALLWQFTHRGQPRAAVGYSFGLLLAALSAAGICSDQGEEVARAAQAMRQQQTRIAAHSPVGENPAKRLAGQMMDRWPLILAGGILSPVARRWRGQVAELAKALAQFEELPEANHNMLAGVLAPEALIGRAAVIFLRADLDHPRILARVDATNQVLMLEGFYTDTIRARGETLLAQQWTSLHFGDYSAYYLAMGYAVDPTPVSAIESLKQTLAEG